MEKVILLDLNKTLAKECHWYMRTYYPQKDVYCQDLVNVLNSEKYSDWEIHLLTARLDNYKEETLAKIAKDVCLRIDKAVFKPVAMFSTPVHKFKRAYAQEILEEFPDCKIKAIESNYNTHKEYKELNIYDCVKRDQFLIQENVKNRNQQRLDF